MQGPGAYSAVRGPLHAVDARVKLAALLAYSVLVFMLASWAALLIFSVAACGVAAVGRVRLEARPALLAPLSLILLASVITGGFALSADAAEGLARMSAAYLPLQGEVGADGSLPALALGSLPSAIAVGPLFAVPSGIARGIFFSIRIVDVLVASLCLTSTTSATELTTALSRILGPLRRLGVPSDDVALTVSLALRFIPVTGEALERVTAAQRSRGAALDDGPLRERIGSWASVFVPLFVSLFRQADRLAQALEARCYGRGARTALDSRSVRVGEWACLAALVLAGAAIALLMR